MANYPIGRLIAELRNRQGISQEELASEICSVSTVSKIENGAQMPKRKVYEALLQRLGMAPRNCTAYVSEKEMKRCILEAEIESLIADGKYEQAKGVLADYVADRCCAETMEISDILTQIEEQQRLPLVPGEGMSRLEIQYALCQLAVLVQQEDCGQALILYERAGQVTIPNLTWKELPQVQLLSRQEIRILCRMAMLLYETGEQKHAKRLLYFLKDYMEYRVVDPEEKLQTYPEIMHVLSHWMGEDGRFDRQLELCDQGIDLCTRQMRQCALPHLLEEKGYALAAREQPEKAQSILKQAYFVYYAIGESARAERLKAKARTLFQIDFA